MIGIIFGFIFSIIATFTLIIAIYLIRYESIHGTDYLD